MCVYMKPVKIYVHLYKLDWETVYIRTVYAVLYNIRFHVYAKKAKRGWLIYLLIFVKYIHVRDVILLIFRRSISNGARHKFIKMHHKQLKTRSICIIQ
jgi:hypothetical protein